MNDWDSPTDESYYVILGVLSTAMETGSPKFRCGKLDAQVYRRSMAMIHDTIPPDVHQRRERGVSRRVLRLFMTARDDEGRQDDRLSPTCLPNPQQHQRRRHDDEATTSKSPFFFKSNILSFICPSFFFCSSATTTCVTTLTFPTSNDDEYDSTLFLSNEFYKSATIPTPWR